MENQNQLTITENPQLLIRRSTDVAGACKEIVTKTAIKIQGKKYVPIEGWMTIATAHGCSLSAADVKAIDGGISAIGEVRRLSDGVVLGRAEGFVGDDEKTWASRALYARRAMAQTRAMSRAARSVFAHVVVLMDSGLSTTPAEEMGHESEEKDVTPPPQETQKPEKKQQANIEQKYIDKIISLYSSTAYDDAVEMLSATKKLIAIVESGQTINMELIREKMKSLFAFDLKNGQHKYNAHLKDMCRLLGMREEEETFEWHHHNNLGAGR